jgi:pimeloyl-ACP methyl ester carboxylesterase
MPTVAGMTTNEPPTPDLAQDGWDIRVCGPESAEQSVLMLPGALATSEFYADLMGEAALAGVRLIAATLPGQGGTPHPADLSIENYAAMASKLAADLGCDVVVGHSLGANVALEMAASGEFRGPLVLLAPSLSRKDESIVPRVIFQLGRVLGLLPYRVVLKIIGPAMKTSIPPQRRDALLADFAKNDPRAIRDHLRGYFPYLDRHGSLAPRLCESGATAWVVFGDRDDVGITDEERRLLEDCPRTHLITIPGAGHLTLVETPARVAEFVKEGLAW